MSPLVPAIEWMHLSVDQESAKQTRTEDAPMLRIPTTKKKREWERGSKEKTEKSASDAPALGLLLMYRSSAAKHGTGLSADPCRTGNYRPPAKQTSRAIACGLRFLFGTLLGYFLKLSLWEDPSFFWSAYCHTCDSPCAQAFLDRHLRRLRV